MRDGLGFFWGSLKSGVGVYSPHAPMFSGIAGSRITGFLGSILAFDIIMIYKVRMVVLFLRVRWRMVLQVICCLTVN